MRIIGMDIHRVTAEVVALSDGRVVRLGRVPMLREHLEAFAKKELTHDDQVVVEATGNAAAVVDVLTLAFASPERGQLIMDGSPSRGEAKPGECSSRRLGLLPRSPGPLRAFYQRIAARRGKHVAAVATAGSWQ